MIDVMSAINAIGSPTRICWALDSIVSDKISVYRAVTRRKSRRLCVNLLRVVQYNRRVGKGPTKAGSKYLPERWM
eukprot:scaffold435438_cov37-Prasinocladus_malaysianus.AAC.1